MMKRAVEIKLKDCPSAGYTTTIIRRGTGTCNMDLTIFLMIENRAGNRMYLEKSHLKNLLTLIKEHFGE